MSYLGQFRTSSRVIAMSALLPTTDMNDRRINVRFVPTPDMSFNRW